MHKKNIAKISKILKKYQNNSTFTAAALGVVFHKNEGFKEIEKYSGCIDRKKKSPPVEKETLFDTASLTKPLVTSLSLLALVKDKKIRFNEKLSCFFPFSIPDDKKNITVEHLLKHCSGLPSHREYFRVLRNVESKQRKATLVDLILQEKLENKPGNKYLYSDLDYMLLGHLIELRSGLNLDIFWQKKITEPLDIVDKFYLFNEKDELREASFVSTGFCPWSKKLLNGVVHDDNCRAYGRLQGHTGLFSSLEGVVSLCKMILLLYTGDEKHPSIKKEDFFFLLKKRKRKRWVYGFDIPTGDNPSSGRFFSEYSIGHLGFTGTSFWIDLQKKIIVVLLTNRVIYGDDSRKIQEMRPLIHNIVMKNLLV